MEEQQGENRLEMSGISKRFPGTQALQDVALSVRCGEVHALLGENGAGKSTLMKIVMGLYAADAGEMVFEGTPVHITSPAQALGIGIAMIHQELNPVPHMSIAENVFLNREPASGPFVRDKEMRRLTAALLEQYGLPFKPTLPMSALTVAQMQMIEIIKAVAFNARLVIMDEPTSSLSSEETENLFATIASLKEKGISIIYISHRMEEIFSICDRVTVLRDGRVVGTSPIADVSRESLITMMVGRKLEQLFPKVDIPLGDVVFEVRGLSSPGLFEDICFGVRRGEILGFSGLIGAGRSEIMRAVFGLDRRATGQVLYEGRELSIRSPRDAMQNGLAMVSEDRKEEGLVLCRSIRENAALPTLRTHQRGLLVNLQKEAREVEDISKALSLRSTGIEMITMFLSGGNQQKVALSKWIMANPKVLILDEPTRGIDVAAKSEIHRLMCQLAAQGISIILISSELEEVMGMSDRILVVHEGRMNGEFLREDIVAGRATQEDILNKAFGG